MGWALALTFIAAVLVAGGVFYSLVYLLDFQEIDTSAKLDAKTLFDLLKLSFGVVAGTGALVALVVAYRRQRVDEAGARREATRLHTERFSQAVDKLGSDSPAVRLGGVHALAGLADDAPDDSLRQTCIDVLCAYLQLPFTPDPGHQEEHHRYLALRKVRHTILRLIGDHFRRPQGHRSWQGCDLDLTGVTIDGPVDFGSAEFSGSTVNFGRSVFSEGTVSFDRATFSGGTVNFDLSLFSGGTVTFEDARFSGGEVSFNHATLSSGEVSFASTTLSGSSTLLFDGTLFSGGTVSFDRSLLSGGTVIFGRAMFAGSAVSFGDAMFHSGQMLFGETMLFNRSLPMATALSGNAEFSGGTVNFDSAIFGRSTVFFSGALFSGGTVSFDQATGLLPDGLLSAIGTPMPATITLPPDWLPANP